LFFRQKSDSNRTCLILDNAQIFGGVAKRNEFVVDGHRLYAPQASVHFQPPLFSATGFDAKRDIAGIVLNRFGHAFVNPQPGFFFGSAGKAAPRDALRNGPFGRIAFSHADLAGAMDHRNAFLESDRAVSQLLDRVLV
jgi:hypothetical protein